MDIAFALTGFEAQIVALGVLGIAAVISLILLRHSLTPLSSKSVKFWLVSISFVLWVTTFICGWLMWQKLTSVPQIRRTSPLSGEIIDSQKPDIHILFAAPVRVNTIAIHTFPEIDFSLKRSGYFWNLSPWATKITVSPKTTLPPGERIMVYLANIEGPVTSGYGGEQLLEIATPETDITEVSPPEGTQNVAANGEFIATVTTSVDEKEWAVRMNPSIAMSVKKDGDKVLKITPNEPFRPSTAYTMEMIHTPIISDRATNEEVKKLDAVTKETIHFTTIRGGLVSSFAPEGKAVDPNIDFKITFDDSMDKEAVIKNLSVSPTVSVKPSWENDDKTLILSHDPLAKDTDYTLTLAKGATTINGGALNEDAVFRFHTAGPLKVLESSPAGGATNIAVKTTVKLTFDQDVPSSIADHLVISPHVPGKKNVSGKTLELIPDSPLSMETRYSVTLTKGAQSEYGLPNTSDETFDFTTTQNQITLAIPFYRQQSLFTCNIAAARMLLSFKGVQVSEADLINAIGLGGKRGSGNPYKGYLDDFGTYWDAISRGVSKYRPVRILTSGNLSEIITEIKKGNPVMTWGQNGWSDPHEISWTASDGTFIRAVNGMHSAVVRGYSGPDNNPTQIFINDPWRGQYAVSKDEFMRRWKFYLVAMVVE